MASRIKSDISNKGLKFIVIFRNPIDRAYSHYWHNFNPGENEYLSFEDALLAEKERLVTNDVDLNNTGRIRHAYFNAGLYANQLQFFFQHFSKESFLFLQFEDIFQKNFSVTMRIVQEFLQTPYEEIEYIHSNISHKFKSRTYNKLLRQKSFPKTILKKTIAPTQRTKIKQALLKANLVPRRYTPMNFATRNLLLKKFRPSIKKLESLIDKDFSAWLK